MFSCYKFENMNEEYEFGKVARQASGSAWLKAGNTVILAAIAIDDNELAEEDFLPLTVQYIEKAYAAGKFPGGFVKRESKPGDFETLTSRVVDRALRPLFPKGFANPVQITITVLSVDEDADLQLLALKAASAALFVSDIPLKTSVSAVRIGRIDGEFVVNPSLRQLNNESTLDLLVAGTKEDLLMIEMRTMSSVETNEAPSIIADPMIDPTLTAEILTQNKANELTEDELIDAIALAEKELYQANAQYEETFSEVAKADREVVINAENINDEMFAYIEANYAQELKTAIARLAKSERNVEIKNVAKKVLTSELAKEQEWDEETVIKVVEKIKRKFVRAMILDERVRADGRSLTEVRPIAIETNVLPRTHASCLFTRGETQALVVLTIGSSQDAQTYENLTDNSSQYEEFMIHYNFPGYSVGEVSRLGPPGRRELGHGNLAKRAIEPTLVNAGGHTLRLVSEILESNGSSSMATVCAGSMALRAGDIDATDLVAGVAMGLVTEDDKYAILTDIMGLEDHDGDMDFKVAGPKGGITALQMDIKLGGISLDILKEALKQANDGKNHILGLMESAAEEIVINEDILPSQEIFSVDPSKIVNIIGQAGKTIKEIIEKFEVAIDLDRDKGSVKVSGKSKSSVNAAKDHIKTITKGGGQGGRPQKPRVQYEVGTKFDGKVAKVVDFGAFVELPDGNDGLLHISKLSKERVNKVTDVVNVGDKVTVEVLNQKGFKLELGLVSVNNTPSSEETTTEESAE